MSLIEDKLKKLNIILPEPKAPVGAYVAIKSRKVIIYFWASFYR